MSQGQDPKGAGECILRRVHKSQCRPDGSVLPVAFRPNKNDDTGISVHFEREISPNDLVAAVAASGKAPQDYYVVRLSMEELYRLGLTVVSEPEPGGPPGHAVIPELRIDEYKRDQNRLKELRNGHEVTS